MVSPMNITTFSQYTDAKTMFASIETQFGGNEATKKTQKTLLKQQYENFNASSIESLDSIFNRLQKIVSRLAILGVVISQEDLNLKILSSLPLEWNTHVVVWMNKAEIETMSIDDLYNNFKIVEQSVKKYVGASSSAQNLSFMTAPSTSSTNDVNTAKPAFDVECFNCHKMGHFARECRAPRTKEAGYLYRGLATVEEQLITFRRKNDVLFSGEVAFLKGNLACKALQNDTGFVDRAHGGRISRKGTLKTDSLDFEDVYFVNELKFNLFSVSQMCDKKNYVLFTDTECLVLSPNFKLPDETQILLKIPRKDNMYSFDMKNIVPKESLTCLVAKATLDESMLWHRRLGHINFKNINKLVKDNLIRGFPTKRCKNDQTCVACLKGKQSFLFTWVFFLTTKDETSEILKNFIKEIENLVDKKVKIIRCDNGTEFKNKVMDDFCREKGIRREYSVARTPQQNGVAERRNRTLIEAARTMLADSKLPTTFWAEAVSTACYVQNRVLVVKPHNKTPYELVRMSNFENAEQERFAYDSSTKDVNAAGKHVNTANLDVNTGSLKLNVVGQQLILAQEEVYVTQPPGFKDLDHPDKVYKSASIPVDLEKSFVKDGDADDVDVHLYRSMIGSLTYLTTSRPDIMFAVCACAKFQVTLKTSHLLALKRIFRYLKGKPTLGLWYSRDSPFELVAYTDSDYVGATQDRKSTAGGCQFLGNRLISWQCKKQTVVAPSTTEAKYVASANCCGQVLWIQN
ncbi:putative ribonuclease H-like domain-containing protein [Tanacetum coccineum]|uniref:Ribonuclease H-like domain-containing protein n=1 Tax=Tanacetum coccineum TaxID=301880 RepID=A0ABQ5B3U0_9ASTR